MRTQPLVCLEAQGQAGLQLVRHAQHPLFGPLRRREFRLPVLHGELLQSLRLLVDSPGGADRSAGSHRERGIEPRTPARVIRVGMALEAHARFDHQGCPQLQTGREVGRGIIAVGSQRVVHRPGRVEEVTVDQGPHFAQQGVVVARLSGLEFEPRAHEGPLGQIQRPVLTQADGVEPTVVLQREPVNSAVDHSIAVAMPVEPG